MQRVRQALRLALLWNGGLGTDPDDIDVGKHCAGHRPRVDLREEVGVDGGDHVDVVALGYVTGHALLLVDGEIPRQRVRDFAVRGDLDCPGNFRRAVDVLVRDLASMPADGDGARRVLALDVLTCDRDEGRVDLVARRSLGLLDRLGDRLHRLVDVHNDALAQPCRRNDALANDRERAVAADLADQRAHLRRADVDTHHDRFAFHVPFRSSLQGVQCPGRSTGSAVG